MKKVFLLTAIIFSIAAASGHAAGPLPENPLAGKKISRQLLETRANARLAWSLRGEHARTVANYYPDSAVQSSWDPTLGQFVPQSNVQYKYNHSADLSEVSYYFDFGIGPELQARETLSWAAPGKLATYTYAETDGNTLVDRILFEMMYDSHGNVQSRIYYVDMGGQTRQQRSGNWSAVMGDSLVTTYNAANQVTSLTFYSLNMIFGTGWEPLLRAENIAYSPNGHPLSMLTEEYDPSTGAFGSPVQNNQMGWGFGFTNWPDVFGMTNPFLADFAILPIQELQLMQPTDYVATYTQTGIGMRSTSTLQAGRVSSFVVESWQDTVWIAEEKYTVSYQGNLVSEYTYHLPDGNGWVAADREYFSFNAQSWLMESHYAYFNGQNWVIDEGSTYAYTFSNNKPVLIETATWSIDSNRYLESRLVEYFYHPGATTATSQYDLLDFEAWPNPTTDILNIRIGDPNKGETGFARVMGLNGQLLKMHEISTAETLGDFKLDLAQLPAGLYLIQLQLGKAQHTLRIVKK